ncbi:MAG TPA: hypothetical protein VFN55_08110 [Solirubrobacteraceae bacterium]|nr:hypothetical protein [Solirubrobacteraceae bacterium]
MRVLLRFVRRLFVAVLVLIVLMIGAVAFALYDPLSGGGHFMERADLIVAPAGTQSPAPAEPTVQATDAPAQAALALRYQPTVVVSALDRFWPVSLQAVLSERWRGRETCLVITGRCRTRAPTLADLSGRATRGDYLRYAAPVDDAQASFLTFAAALGIPEGILRLWPLHLGQVDPFRSAQIYFHELPRTTRHSYPGLPAGLISLEYWCFYPLNYFPLVRIPLEALSNPIGSTLGNTDYHQGDLEHVAVLLDPRTMRPRYLWMARHADEGEAFRWHSRQVQWDGDHATIYVALGSHASYAHCGIQRRSRTYEFINDYVPCLSHETYGFLWNRTPLVDLDHTDWGCWRGHLGEAGPGLRQGAVGLAPYETAGPYSPLLQGENFATTCHVSPSAPKPASPL